MRVKAIVLGQMESGMTLSLSEEVRAGRTADVPLGRLGRPQERAGDVADLAAEAAAYVTGQTMIIGGGLRLR